MIQTSITPEESVLLIAKTIQAAKSRFRENGGIYILWGSLITLTSLGQFILLELEFYRENGWPYFIMPLAGIYTYLYYRKKFKKLPKTIIGSILSTMGIVLGLNFMILGFFFWDQLGTNLVPVFLVMMALWIIISGISIKYKPFILGGIVLNLMAFATFFLEWNYHPLIVSAGSAVAILIPGIFLYYDKRKAHV